MAKCASYLAFPTGTRAAQPGNAEHDMAGFPPSTSLDMRIDLNIGGSSTTSRIIMGIGLFAAGTGNEVIWSTGAANGTRSRFQHNNGANDFGPTTNGYWVYGSRHQYRVLWSGTNVTVYKRDPATFDLELNDDTNWTSFATTASFLNISSYVSYGSTPIRVFRRDTGDGWNAFDLYEILIRADGTNRAHFCGDQANPNFGADTFDDNILGAAKWSWVGTDPTFQGPVTATFGFATGVNTAQPFTATLPLLDEYGFTTSTDEAQAFVAAADVTDEFDFATGTDTAQDFETELTAGGVDATFGFATSTSQGRPFEADVIPIGLTPFALANEINVAQAFTAFTTQTEFDAPFGRANETDEAQPWAAYANVPVVVPPPNRNFDHGDWNCGEWTVWIADRFGNAQYQLSDVVSVNASPMRIIDNVSKISVSLGESCSPSFLCDIRPWGNELQLRLDGEIQWAGPIQDALYEYEPGNAAPGTIEAADLLEWLRVRVLRGSIAAGNVGAQFARIISNAMSGDNVGLTPKQFGKVNVSGRLRITDVTSALEEIIDLAPFLDFTMHGRELLVGGEEVPFTTLPTLRLPGHANLFTLRRPGGDEASQVFMRGGEDFELNNFDRAVGVYPAVRKADPDIGIVQRRVYDTSILEPKVAATAAYSYFQYARPPAWTLDVTLNMKRVPFEFGDLIAGSTIPVYFEDLPCFQHQNGNPFNTNLCVGCTGEERLMRIRSVGLSLESNGEERVTLDLIPAGVFNKELARAVAIT